MRIYIAVCLITTVLSSKPYNKLFSQERIIFSSDFNITSIIAPAVSDTNVLQEPVDMPNVFFTVADPKLEGGSCIYVLQGLAAYEILEGGRDTTSDYSNDPTIYFGSNSGIYKYYPDTLSAKKFGPFNDDIKQIQKAAAVDVIYFLTTENKLFKVEQNATVKIRITSVTCATEFVLDTSNNIYYLSCGDNLPHVIKADGNMLGPTANLMEDFNYVKLLRPAFMMESCVPFLGDGFLYILNANGTGEKRDLYLQDRPSAISVDASIYVIAALNGKIYEFNVMDILLKSMFGTAEGVGDMMKIMIQAIDKSKDYFQAYRSIVSRK